MVWSRILFSQPRKVQERCMDELGHPSWSDSAWDGCKITWQLREFLNLKEQTIWKIKSCVGFIDFERFLGCRILNNRMNVQRKSPLVTHRNLWKGIWDIFFHCLYLIWENYRDVRWRDNGNFRHRHDSHNFTLDFTIGLPSISPMQG